MSVIATVEDAIVGHAKATLGFPDAPVVKVAETLPGQWTLEALRRALQHAPGVYVGFIGGPAGVTGGYLNARFALYAIAKGASEHARRRGTAVEIGAYDIIERLAVAFDQFSIDAVGSIFVRSVDNLFREAMFDLGGSVYGLTLEVPNMPWPDKNTADLAPFITYHAEHSIVPGDEEPEAIDEVTLPQP